VQRVYNLAFSNKINGLCVSDLAPIGAKWLRPDSVGQARFAATHRGVIQG
jgi:hypothetical protein